MSKSIVDANYRFIAAYQEVNARVAQRQQALALYISLVASLLAALVALRPTPGTPPAPIEWLTLGFPVASLCFALLNHRSERAITNLRTFLACLERLGEAEHGLPSYNADPQWSANANKARRYHDYAVLLLATGGNVIGLGAAQVIHGSALAASRPLFVVAGVLAVLSLLLMLFTMRWSYRPEAPAA